MLIKDCHSFGVRSEKGGDQRSRNWPTSAKGNCQITYKRSVLKLLSWYILQEYQRIKGEETRERISLERSADMLWTPHVTMETFPPTSRVTRDASERTTGSRYTPPEPRKPVEIYTEKSPRPEAVTGACSSEEGGWTVKLEWVCTPEFVRAIDTRMSLGTKCGPAESCLKRTSQEYMPKRTSCQEQVCLNRRRQEDTNRHRCLGVRERNLTVWREFCSLTFTELQMKTYQLHSVSKESTNALQERVLKISQAHWEFWRSPRPIESFEDPQGPLRVLKISQAHWEFWRSPRPIESQFQHPPNPEGAISGHDSSAEELLSWPPPSLKKTPVWELGADLPF